MGVRHKMEEAAMMARTYQVRNEAIRNYKD